VYSMLVVVVFLMDPATPDIHPLSLTAACPTSHLEATFALFLLDTLKNRAFEKDGPSGFTNGMDENKEGFLVERVRGGGGGRGGREGERGREGG